MPKLSFFDCNCTVGRRSKPRPENNLSLEQILNELNYVGVSQALAVHAYAREFHPPVGNERISRICEAHSQLTPCYVVLPHHTGEIPGGDALIRYLADGGARAVRLFPKDHSYGLGETWCGALFGALEEAGVPVLVDLDQTDWREIDGVLAAHPRLNLILLQVGYRSDRWLYPLVERYPGLRVESGSYSPYRGIEALTRRFGPDRIVFGTGLPVWDAGSAIATVQYAEIDEESRLQIASETLRGLLWNGA
ncbi:MAG: hypothetical protein A3F84_19770 [Candidatus Handelsmanbacteria bacterium RIFCSPLOWO2_12_FULL_64_10]|uniref:Amidohydrolase-related domain-containing protein n=1 Tax=Handelsmanbacteria sp. (strain RIFCSPLOWO2_12_FULL_64_10) TaxID=1817868 RepID=A0A1F6CSV6_HANXR|nr:MAG: hypothetical protein A3F84_19770 [Candidatus Handelsmanbacteria bacterium RIFCSPLOWO2_12_FULL_64_10]